MLSVKNLISKIVKKILTDYKKSDNKDVYISWMLSYVLVFAWGALFIIYFLR